VLGASVAMVGVGKSTVNATVLVAVPPGVVTATRPEVAPAGTTNVSLVASATVKPPTATPFSVSALAPVRLVPVTVTLVPTRPWAGAKLTSVGAGVVTVNVAGADVPPPGAGLVTVMPTVPAAATALAGTSAVSCVAETYVVATNAPLKLTTELFIKPVPFTVSVKALLPATAVLGVRLVIVGTRLSGGVTVKTSVL
jgi:hypothetical protein